MFVSSEIFSKTFMCMETFLKAFKCAEIYLFIFYCSYGWRHFLTTLLWTEVCSQMFIHHLVFICLALNFHKTLILFWQPFWLFDSISFSFRSYDSRFVDKHAQNRTTVIQQTWKATLTCNHFEKGKLEVKTSMWMSDKGVQWRRTRDLERERASLALVM